MIWDFNRNMGVAMETLFTTKDLMFNHQIAYEDLSIPRGITSWIKGESGSGKSSLLKMLNRTISQSKGSIFYEETDIENFDPLALRKEVLLVSQSVFLFDMSIRDNYKEYYNYLDLPSPTDSNIKKYLNICMANFDLDSKCIKLSGGERQRVYLSIFLSLNPKVILLDEPTASLDYKTADSVMRNIIAHCKDHSITPIVVSHESSLDNTFSENTIIIERTM